MKTTERATIEETTEVADRSRIMEKHIVGENGISYTLGADGYGGSI